MLAACSRAFLSVASGAWSSPQSRLYILGRFLPSVAGVIKKSITWMHWPRPSGPVPLGAMPKRKWPVWWLFGSFGCAFGAPTLSADVLRHSAESSDDAAFEEFNIEKNHNHRVLLKLVSRLAHRAERNQA